MLIAHRGESFDAPENTLAATNLAWEREADAVEIDVHLTRDQKVVVIHDDHIGRMARKRRKIKELCLNELKALDAGRYKGPQWAGQKIPTLSEVLQTCPKQKSVFIEIKCGPEIFPALEAEIKQSNLAPEQIKLIGFDLETMAQAKKRFGALEVLLNAEARNACAMPDLITRIQKYGLDGINLGFAEWIDKSLIDKIKQQAMKLYIWTVNDPEKAGLLLKAGVHGIMTDRLQQLRTELRKRSY